MPEECQQYTYAELEVGQKAEFEFMMTDEVIADFAKLSGDKSPLHTDAAYSATTAFGHPVGHGMIAGMLFSRLVGMELPGKYAVYLSQTLKFHQPMFSGDRLIIKGEIIKKTDAFQMITLATGVYHGVTGILFVDGDALVRVLQ